MDKTAKTDKTANLLNVADLDNAEKVKNTEKAKKYEKAEKVENTEKAKKNEKTEKVKNTERAKKYEKTEKIDMFFYESQYYEKGFNYIAGVDEVGRGPLAGEVVCASVIMPKGSCIEGVNDSKKLSEKKRELLYDLILKEAVAVNIYSVDAQKIDEINILEATKICMKGAVLGLSTAPDVVFIDALKLDLPCETLSIIKGDAKSYTIACASIVAKVFRDRKMLEYAKLYPEYFFEKHKGYGTAVHIDAIKKHGLSPIHRKSFTKGFVNEKQ